MIEKPKTNKFRSELRSIYCRFEIPTSVIKPNTQQKPPPMTGSGIVVEANTAPNFPITANTIMRAAPY